MAEIEPKTREEKLWNGEDIEPVTREEMYIKHIFDKTQTIPDYPITRKEMLMEKAGEGGGGDITIKQLTATENRTYSEEGTAYSPVIVNVPDVPPVLDELTVTENGTYTPPSGTDGYDEVTVSVPLPSNAYLLKEIEDVAIASFNDGADLPMPKLKVAIEPQQEGSGDPSPTNVRPISGWDECKVTRTGKNLSKSQTNNSVLCSAKKGVTYTVSFEGNVGANIKKNTNSGEVVIWGAQLPLTFTADEDFNIYLNAWNANISNIQVEVGNQATTYEPYNGSTYTIDLDGTRYGCTLDVVSGVLTVDKVAVDLGSLTWTTAGSGRHNVTITGAKPSGNTEVTNAVCSNYAPSSYSQIAEKDFSFFLGYQNTPLLQVNDSNLNGVDATAFKTAMNGVQLVYELATPQNIQLTPTQVKSLLGVNNVWCDTGETEVEYFAKEVS